MRIAGEMEYFVFLSVVPQQFLVYHRAEDRFQPHNNHLNRLVPIIFVIIKKPKVLEVEIT